MDKRERVMRTLNGEAADRPPVYDLLCNDAVIEYYSGEKLTFDNATEVVAKAYCHMLDATRLAIPLPQRDGVEVDKDGCTIHRQRWTAWYKGKWKTVEELEQYVKTWTETLRDWTYDHQREADQQVDNYFWWQDKLGDTVLFANFLTKTGLMTYASLGIELYSYLLADNPVLMAEFYEAMTERSEKVIENLRSFDFPAVFVCEDIAFKGTPFFSPEFLRRHFFPHLERIIAAYHRRGIKFLFHSDGNLMPILDDLVAAGIDGLNPIEVVAGMDIREIRKKYPRLVLLGGIDCSQLLAFGTPEQVRKVTLQTIQEAGPGYFVGSTTELHNNIPLDNVRTMVETAWGYRY